MGLKDICAGLHARVEGVLHAQGWNPDAKSFEPRPWSPSAASDSSTVIPPLSPPEEEEDLQKEFESQITLEPIPPRYMNGLQNDDPWCIRRYTENRRPVYPVVLKMHFIERLLARVSPRVAESILLIGIAVKTRNTTHPQSGPQHREDLHLLSQLVHAHDTTNSLSGHGQYPIPSEGARSERHKHSSHRHTAPRLLPNEVYPAVIASLPQILARHIILNRRSTKIERDTGLTSTTRELNMPLILTLFSYIEKHTTTGEMEEIFLLGCAGALRNLITCLQTLARRSNLQRADPLDEVREFFYAINQRTIPLKQRTGTATSSNEEITTIVTNLQYDYGMLSAIMHANDHREKRRSFFRDPNNPRVYVQFYDTLRCEVLTYVFLYFVIPPGMAEAEQLLKDPEYRSEYERGVEYAQSGVLRPLAKPGPTRSPMPHDYIAHMVRGPTHFFSQFPLL